MYGVLAYLPNDRAAPHPGRFAVALIACLAIAAPASAETLAAALSQAYATNPSIGAARYDVRARDEAIVQARAELRPQANVEVTGAYEETRLGRTSRAANPFGAPVTAGPAAGASLVVDQPITTGGRASADRRLAEADVRTAREALRATEGDLMLAVITAYMDVRRHAAALDIYRGSVVELERIDAEITARREGGELTLTDVAQSRAQLQIAREQVVAIEQALEGARADYGLLVGHAPGVLADPPALPALPATVDLAYDLAEGRNPDLAEARFREVASRQNIASVRATGRPTLSLRGSAAVNGDTYPYRIADQDKSFAGSVVLTIPITAGGRIASQVRQATERNGGDRFRVEAERRQVIRDTTDAWNAIVSADRQRRLIGVQVEAAAAQLDGMITEYRGGLRSTFDVLYAQQQLRDARVAELGSARDAYVAEATLLRRTGLLQGDTILSGVPLHDPATHLRAIASRDWVPWEPVVHAVDRVASAPPRPKPLARPADPVAEPAVRTGGASIRAEQPLAGHAAGWTVPGAAIPRR